MKFFLNGIDIVSMVNSHSSLSVMLFDTLIIVGLLSVLSAQHTQLI